VQPVAEAACAAVPSDTAVDGTDQSQFVPESKLNPLMHEYHDRFLDVLPPGLPPERNIGHAIVLEPGSKLPFRHAYRLSPRELAEAKSQIADLVARGQLCLVVHRTLLLSCSCRERMALCACVLTVVLRAS